jgi:3'-5' exoribonuclease
MNTHQYIDLIEDPNLRKSCKKILDTPDFFTHPASTGIHHGYVGGLVVHTLEVLDYAVALSKSFPQTDLDVLIAAGLWHDYAKIWDYKLVTIFEDEDLPKYYVLVKDYGNYKKVYISDSKYKNQIHHITGSTAEFTAAAISAGVNRDTIQKVQHCIIGHHGRKDWGSIKEPQTLEAWLLHSADYTSAHFGPRKDK